MFHTISAVYKQMAILRKDLKSFPKTYFFTLADVCARMHGEQHVELMHNPESSRQSSNNLDFHPLSKEEPELAVVGVATAGACLERPELLVETYLPVRLVLFFFFPVSFLCSGLYLYFCFIFFPSILFSRGFVCSYKSS